MVNRNQYKQLSNKKKLHKVRKRWLIVSTALLSAIGMGIVSSVPSHADSINKTNSVGQQAQGSTSTTTQSAQGQRQQSAEQDSSAHNPYIQDDQQPMSQSTSPQFTDEHNVDIANAGTSQPTSMWTGQSISNTNYNVQSASSRKVANYNTYLSQSTSQAQDPVQEQSAVSSVSSYHRPVYISYASNIHPIHRLTSYKASQAPSSNSSTASDSARSSQNKSKSDYSVVKSLVNSFNVSKISSNNTDNHLDSVLKTNTWNNKGLDNSSSNTSRLSGPQIIRQKADNLSRVLHQNSWPDHSVLGKGYHLESTDDDTVNVVGNPVTYSGDVTLHFYNHSNKDIKDITEPYSVNSRVGDQVTVLNPNSYLNTTIRGLNTSDFKSDDNASAFVHTVQGTEGPNKSGNTVTKNYTLNFTKMTPDAPVTDTDTIKYLYNGNQVGGTVMHGPNGSQGIADGNGLNSQYKLTGNDTFKFSNGIHSFNVALSHPQPKPSPKIDTDTIEYMYNGAKVGPSVSMKGAAGNNGIAGVSIPNGYKLANDGTQDFTYNNGTHRVNVNRSVQPVPNPVSQPADTDVVDYEFNDKIISSTTTHGKNGYTATADGSNMPDGYKLADDGTQRFVYDNGTHHVNIVLTAPHKSQTTPQPRPQPKPNPEPVQPTIDTDVIDYIYNNKTLGSTVMHGQNGITATASGDNLPSGYKIVNDGSSSFAYDNGTHYVNVMPVDGKATDTISFTDNGKSIATVDLAGPINTSVDLASQLPKGYKLTNSSLEKISFDGDPHNIAVEPSAVKASSSKIIINYVNAKTGTTIHTTPITGAVGAQFNYQQFDNLVPVGGYSFVRIDNPIAQFTSSDQVMTVTVAPIQSHPASSSANSPVSDTSKAGNRASSSAGSKAQSSSSHSASSASASTSNSDSKRRPITSESTHPSSSDDVSHGVASSQIPDNTNTLNNSVPAWYGPDQSMDQQSMDRPDMIDDNGIDKAAGAPQVDNSGEYDQGYWKAYRDGMKDAFTGRIDHTYSYMNNPSAYLRGYQSYRPDQVINGNDNGVDTQDTPGTVPNNGSAVESDNIVTDNNSQGAYYPAPAVGSLWEDQYEVYEDQNGEYIIVDGVKLYWNTRDCQFDLILTDNGFHKYDISQLGL